MKQLVGGKEVREKVVEYLRSVLFPWNFIFENVEKDAIKHFIPYACAIEEVRVEGAGEELKPGRVKEMIAKEVKGIVADYLFNPDDKNGIKRHDKFAHVYPFAFSQCLAHTILYRLGLKMEDIVEVKAIAELVGRDIKEIKKREIFIRDVISTAVNGDENKNETKNKGIKGILYLRGESIFDKKVITTEGYYIGTVNGVIFDSKTGHIEELQIKKNTRFFSKLFFFKEKFFRKSVYGKSALQQTVSMEEVKLNMYSGNFIYKRLKKSLME